MIVKPFRAFRPRQDLADRIPCPPYDVVSTDEARALAQNNPYSFLHVIRPEIDLDSKIPADDPRVYERARESFASMIGQGWLVRDERPSYYVYRLTHEGRSQTGILGAAAVGDYEAGRIKRHEHTRPEKEQDRIRLNDSLSAHPGPVFLTYHGLPELNAVVNGVVAGPVVISVTGAGDVTHELWVVDESVLCAKIERLFAAVRCSYVADGHHRAAAAAKVAALRSADAAPDENGAAEPPVRFFLAAHFPADQLKVLDYNRVVRDLNGLDVETLLERLTRAGFHVKADHRTKRPPSAETFGMYVEGHWYLLTPRPDLVPTDHPVRRLDVSILTERVLQPILGIGDPRTDRRIDFVGGIRGMAELERRVDSRQDAVAFALYPTRLADVMRVADAGQVMPPKSTWFEPKLLSGLVVQSFADERL